MMRTPRCTSSSSALQRKTLTGWRVRPSNRCCSHLRLPKLVELPFLTKSERKNAMSQSITHTCANCGSSVPDNMRFCPNCGTLAGTPQAPPPPPVNAAAQTQRAASFTEYPQQNNQPAYQPPPAQAQ